MSKIGIPRVYWKDGAWRYKCNARQAKLVGKTWIKLGTDEKEALAAIAHERRRQVEAEGWTTEHDDEHADGAMSLAAACYALPGDFPQRNRYVMSLWPWDAQWWKPGTALPPKPRKSRCSYPR